MEYTNTLMEHLQRTAEQHGEAAGGRAKEAFVDSVRYEWMFWEQTWTLQAWPV